MSKNRLKLEGIEKIRSDFKELISMFKEMLESLGENDLAALIPMGNDQPSGDPAKVSDQKLAQAIGISFELLNLVEENAATQFRRKTETILGLETTRGSWGETLQKWKIQPRQTE